MNSASYEYRYMSARRGAQFVQLCPLECRLSVGKPFPPKTTKMLSTRNSSMLMMSSSVYLFFESECFLTKRTESVLRDLKPEICICDFYFCDNSFG